MESVVGRECVTVCDGRIGADPQKIEIEIAPQVKLNREECTQSMSVGSHPSVGEAARHFKEKSAS